MDFESIKNDPILQKNCKLCIRDGYYEVEVNYETVSECVCNYKQKTIQAIGLFSFILISFEDKNKFDNSSIVTFYYDSKKSAPQGMAKFTRENSKYILNDKEVVFIMRYFLEEGIAELSGYIEEKKIKKVVNFFSQKKSEDLTIRFTKIAFDPIVNTKSEEDDPMNVDVSDVTERDYGLHIDVETIAKDINLVYLEAPVGMAEMPNILCQQLMTARITLLTSLLDDNDVMLEIYSSLDVANYKKSMRSYSNNTVMYIEYLKRLKKLAMDYDWNPKKKRKNYFEDCITELDQLSHWFLVLFSFCLSKIPANRDWIKKKERTLCILKLKINCKSMEQLQPNHQTIIEEIIGNKLMKYDTSEKYLVNIKAIQHHKVNSDLLSEHDMEYLKKYYVKFPSYWIEIPFAKYPYLLSRRRIDVKYVSNEGIVSTQQRYIHVRLVKNACILLDPLHFISDFVCYESISRRFQNKELKESLIQIERTFLDMYNGESPFLLGLNIQHNLNQQISRSKVESTKASIKSKIPDIEECISKGISPPCISYLRDKMKKDKTFQAHHNQGKRLYYTGFWRDMGFSEDRINGHLKETAGESGFKEHFVNSAYRKQNYLEEKQRSTFTCTCNYYQNSDFSKNEICIFSSLDEDRLVGYLKMKKLADDVIKSILDNRSHQRFGKCCDDYCRSTIINNIKKDDTTVIDTNVLFSIENFRFIKNPIDYFANVLNNITKQ